MTASTPVSIFRVKTVPTVRYTEYHVLDADGSSVYVSLFEKYAQEKAEALNAEYVSEQFTALQREGGAVVKGRTPGEWVADNHAVYVRVHKRHGFPAGLKCIAAGMTDGDAAYVVTMDLQISELTGLVDTLRAENARLREALAHACDYMEHPTPEDCVIPASVFSKNCRHALASSEKGGAE